MLRRLAPLALLVLGCKPTPAAPPSDAAADPAPTPVAAAEGSASEPAPPPGAGTVPAAVASTEPAAPAEPTEPVEPTDATTPQAEPTDESAPPTDTSSKPVASALPKPIFKDVKASCGRDAGVGTKLKGFKLKDLSGKEVTQGRYRKRVMLVNFWGTWCKPCLKELPEFDRLYRRYRKHGMTLVAIATDDDPAPVQAFVDKRKLRAKMLLGGESYASQYGAPNFPFSYVVDTTGTIVGSYHGFKEECMGKLEDDLRTAMNKRNGN